MWPPQILHSASVLQRVQNSLARNLTPSTRHSDHSLSVAERINFKYPSSHSTFCKLSNLLICLTSVTSIDLLGSSDHATKFSSLSAVFPMHLHLELSFSFTAHPLEFPATQYSFNHFLN